MSNELLLSENSLSMVGNFRRCKSCFPGKTSCPLNRMQKEISQKDLSVNIDDLVQRLKLDEIPGLNGNKAVARTFLCPKGKGSVTLTLLGEIG